MYRDRFDIKNAEASEIYKKIDLKYYDAEIYDIEKRISNIRLGKAEYYGYGKYYSQNVLTGKEKENRIRTLERRLKEVKRLRSKYADVVSLARHTEYELERAAKRDALHDLFHDVLRDVEYHYNPEKKEMQDSTFVEKFKKPIIKARRKDASKLSKERHKIDKKLYHVLKRNAKKMRLLINDNGLSLDYVIRESRYSIDSLLWNIYHEKSKDLSKHPYLLGVDTRDLERAREIIKEKFNEGSHDFCVGNSKTKYHDLSIMYNKESYAAINSKIYKFLGMYEDVLTRGKELLALKRLLSAFSKTEYKDSESYINLQNVCEKIEANLLKAVEKANSEFEKANLPELIENYKKLEELYREYLRCLAEHSRSKDAQYSWSEHIREANEYRAEMIAIVFKYPELNRPEYKIDLERKKKKSLEEVITETMGYSPEPDIKLGLSADYQEKVERRRVQETESGPSGKTDYEIKVDRKRAPEYTTEEPAPVFVPPTERKVEDKTDDEKLKESIETPSYLSGLVTVYYPQYVRFKAENPNQANMAFSEYLQYVRPDLKELIEIERQKEERVETIFKKYIKYRASLGNKERALSFRAYAKIYYNVENYDIPQEYDERVKGL